MRISWIPREQKFFDMFDETVELIVKAAEVFVNLVERFDNCERRVNELRELEHRCDRSVERILNALGRTFITPLDREDIHALAKNLDDVLDNLDDAAFRLTAFNLEHPPHQALKMALIIQQSCGHVQRAIHLCRGNLGAEEIADELREISRLRNEADEVYRQVEVNLFTNPPEIMTLIKQRELYARLNRTIVACCDVAHNINEIVVKGS